MGGGFKGFIRSANVIICSKKLLMLFSLASNQERKFGLGGGLVSSVWEINYSKRTIASRFKSKKN